MKISGTKITYDHNVIIEITVRDLIERFRSLLMRIPEKMDGHHPPFIKGGKWYYDDRYASECYLRDATSEEIEFDDLLNHLQEALNRKGVK